MVIHNVNVALSVDQKEHSNEVRRGLSQESVRLRTDGIVSSVMGTHSLTEGRLPLNLLKAGSIYMSGYRFPLNASDNGERQIQQTESYCAQPRGRGSHGTAFNVPLRNNSKGNTKERHIHFSKELFGAF